MRAPMAQVPCTYPGCTYAAQRSCYDCNAPLCLSHSFVRGSPRRVDGDYPDRWDNRHLFPPYGYAAGVPQKAWSVAAKVWLWMILIPALIGAAIGARVGA